MSGTLSPIALILLLGSALASWAVLAVAATRADRWIVVGTALRILLAGAVLVLLREGWPAWPGAAVGLVVAAVVLSAELPSWFRTARHGAEESASALGESAPVATETNGSGSTRLDDVQLRFLNGLVSLKNKTVAQTMVTRDRMVTVNQDWTVGRAAKAIQPTEYARIPVVGRNRREVVGVVHRKDLLLLLHSHQEATFVKNICRDVEFVPGSQRLDRLLVKFQKERVHLAVVPDEYGRAAGLITLDDILTEALKPREVEESAT